MQPRLPELPVPEGGLALRGVTKELGGRTILSEIDLAASPGVTLGLMGHNGAGKTTLLRIIAGSVTADRGEVLVAGQTMGARTPAARAQVGTAIGDEHSWYWRLTGRQNLEVFGGMRGLSRSEASGQSEALLAELKLEWAADKPLSMWSSGMKGNLALARARLGDPSVIVLDEATRAMDEVARERFARWAVGHPGVIVLTSHSVEEAHVVCDEVVVLREGRVESRLGSHPLPTMIHEALSRR